MSQTLKVQSDPAEKHIVPSGDSQIYFIISECKFSPSNILHTYFFYLKSYIRMFSSVNATARIWPDWEHESEVGMTWSDLNNVCDGGG